MVGNIVEKNEYDIYETESFSKYNRKTIVGKTVGCSRCVGYCKYNGHPGFLTEDLRETHNCREKGCNYYIPKPRREKTDKPNTADIARWVLETALTATTKYEGMRVISISKYNETECILRYATVSNTYPIKEVEKILTDALGMTVRMKKIECDFDVAAQLVFSN